MGRARNNSGSNNNHNPPPGGGGGGGGGEPGVKQKLKVGESAGSAAATFQHQRSLTYSAPISLRSTTTSTGAVRNVLDYVRGKK